MLDYISKMIESKKVLFELCNQLVNERVQMAEDGLKQAQAAANNETKSSAGDKYEIGRAMMHLEKEKLSIQLSEAIKMRKALLLINPEKTSIKGELGSIVKTATASYFLAISAGALKVGEETYFAISPVSPIGQLLIGKVEGDKIEFGGKQSEIMAIS
jgi:transcription elongation GreA/GreB family factor